MVTLGLLKLDGTPKIVASVTDRIARSRVYKSTLFDIVELRIDLFTSFEPDAILPVAAQFKAFPIIATIRSRTEGGAWNKSERERLLLFKKIIPHVDAVDIELSAKTILKEVVDTAHRKKKTVILSYHNFDKTPSLTLLNQVLKKGHRLKGDIIKIATLTPNRKALQQLARFTVMNSNRNIIAIAMGNIGALSRVFFPALGSLMTYTFFGKPTAPGQINCLDLSRLIKRFYPTEHKKG